MQRPSGSRKGRGWSHGGPPVHLVALVDSPDHVCCRYRWRRFGHSWSRPATRWSCGPGQRRAGGPGTLGGPAARMPMRSSSSDGCCRAGCCSCCAGSAAADLRLRRRRLPARFLRAKACTAAGGRRGSPASSAPPTWWWPAIASWPTRPSLTAPAPMRCRSFRPASILERYRPADHRRSRDVELVWIGSSSTLQGLERARPLLEAIGQACPERLLEADLRPLPGAAASAGRALSLVRGDGSRRNRGRGHRHQLGAGRRLEPRQVRPEGAAIHGGGPAGGRQPGRRAGGPGSPRRQRLPGANDGRMVPGHPPAGGRSVTAPPPGPGRSWPAGGRVQRDRRRRPLGHPAQSVAEAPAAA